MYSKKIICSVEIWVVTKPSVVTKTGSLRPITDHAAPTVLIGAMSRLRAPFLKSLNFSFYQLDCKNSGQGFQKVL